MEEKGVYLAIQTPRQVRKKPMYKNGMYRETDKMSDLICENYPMVLVMSRFGIALGFGTFAASHTVAETQKFVEDTIVAAPGLRLEYFELVGGNTLQRIADWEDTSYAVGCITVFCGEVRLIDNIKYKE